MTWWIVPGMGYVNDQEQDVPFWGEMGGATWGVEGIRQMPTYTNSYQFPGDDGSSSSFQWEPGAAMPQMAYTPPGYVQTLLQMADEAEAGQLKDYERELWEEMRAQALSVPTRDLSRLTSAAKGGYWGGVPEDPQEAAWYLSQGSPDLGAIMLGLRDKLRAGTATDAERTLFEDVRKADAYQNWVASTPQPSDAFNPISNEFFMALNALGMAGGAMAATAPAASLLTQLGYGAGMAAQGTNMLGQALDEQGLMQASMVLGLLGGGAGAAQAASGGISSFGEALTLAQKVYGVGNKAYQVAQAWSGQSGPEDPAAAGLANPEERLYSMDPSYQASDATTQRGGLPMDTSNLGGIIAGVVGLAGTGLSLADVKRYLDQMKAMYGDQKQVRDLIESAYTLAAARAETFYSQGQDTYGRNLQRYQDELGRFNQYVSDQQRQGQQEQAQFVARNAQVAEDRARQIQRDAEEYGRTVEAYRRQVQETGETRGIQRQAYGEDRQRLLESYDERRRQAAEERALDVAGYQQRQAIGAGLRDPAQIAAGARGIYNPLSDLAREQISREVQGEMAMRGVTGGGQFANLMSAKAFAPFERELWSEALRGWLTGQQTALSAYGNVDLASTPEYQMTQLPTFAQSPEYVRRGVPQFAQFGMGDVPDAVVPGKAPEVPAPFDTRTANYPVSMFGVMPWGQQPAAPFGTSPSTGGPTAGVPGSGVIGGTQDLIGQLFKLGSQLGWWGSGADVATPAQAAATIEQYRSIYGPLALPGGGTQAGSSTMLPDAGGYGPYESGYNFPDQSMYGPYLPDYQYAPDVGWPDLDLSY